MKFPLAVVLLLTAVVLRADPEYPKRGADIYDVQADGTAGISTALAKAKTEHKRVLLDLGANWCVWCHRLHDLFETNPPVGAALHENYVLLLVDVNHRDGKKRNDAVNEKYGNPVAQGLPVLLVLDADGTLLTTQETGALENGKDGHDPEKVIAFLKKWAPQG